MNIVKIMLHAVNYCNLSCEYCSSNIPYISKYHNEIDITRIPILLSYILSVH